MESEPQIIMEPLLGDKEEVVVTVTKDAESLNPIVLVGKETTYGVLKRKVMSLCRVNDVLMVYINTKGDVTTLSNEEEFQEAWSQALLTKQLHIIIEPSSDIVAPPKPKHTNAYSRLAAEIGEDKKIQCQKVAKSLLKEEHRRNCSGDTDDWEPMWFVKAMEKYTDKVIKAVVGSGSASAGATPTMGRSTNSLVIHEDIVCDGCEQGIIGVRYKCGNCPDYDLCEGCEQMSAFIHNEDHAFIKIKRPAKFAGVSRKGKRKPLLKRSVYALPTVIMINKPETEADVVLKFKHKEDKHKGDKHKEDKHKHKEDKHKDSKKDKKSESTSETPNKGSEQPAMVRRSKEKLREELKHSKFHRHGDEGADQPPLTGETLEPIGWEPTEDMIKKTKKQLKKDLREARRKKRMEKGPSADQDSSCDEANASSVDNSVKVVTNEATPPDTTLQEPSKGHGKCLGATFVEDTSYPDDSVVYYGKPFTKGWIIENTGTKTWKKVKLVYQNGYHPDEPEISIPNMEPGQQVEIVAEYPSVSPSDGVEIRSSWRLIHDGHTPFGDVLWLSIIAQPDPSEELLSGTFEMISYPTFSSNPDDDDTEIPESLGFTHEETKSTSPTDSTHHDSAQNIGGAYTMVDPPTPVLSLTSNDSLFQINDDDVPSHDEDDFTDNVKSTTNDENSDDEDDEFVVIIPDCFKLNVPIPGFKPPITEPMSPDKENPGVVSDSPVCGSNDKETTPTPIDDESFKEDVEKDSVTIQSQPTSSPKSAQRKLKLGGFSFGRDTLETAWTSRSTNPLRYAVGVVNTVSELVDQHVHFGLQKSSDEEDYTTPEEDTATTTPPDNTTTTPPNKRTAPSNFTPPAPPQLSDITQQEPDVSRFLNNKWAGHQTPASSMDQLVSMGFANRDLNRKLLDKHNNDLQNVVQELLESNGEGFL